jgi:hypothetical protein
MTLSRFSGPQPGVKIERGSFGTNGPKGAQRRMKEIRREEAEERNAKTKPENRRQHRLGLLPPS